MAFYKVTLSFYRSKEEYLPPLAGTWGKHHYIVRAANEEDLENKFFHAYPNAEREGDLSVEEVSEQVAKGMVSRGEADVVRGSVMVRHWPWAERSRKNPRRRSTGYVAAKIRANTARRNGSPAARAVTTGLFEVMLYFPALGETFMYEAEVPLDMRGISGRKIAKMQALAWAREQYPGEQVRVLKVMSS